MAHKVSVYLDDASHHVLKAAASAAGVSLSTFMANAALRALKRTDRKKVVADLASLRHRLAGRVAAEGILAWRSEGRE